MASLRVIQVDKELDIARARHEARLIVEDLGFSNVKVMQVLIAVTELATNLHVHASPGGKVILDRIQWFDTPGIQVISQDVGPGIADLELAMQDRYSTVGSMGCGLPAVKRLMDEFEVETQIGLGKDRGTRIVARKWRN